MLCKPTCPYKKGLKNKVSFCIMCSLSFSLSNINIYFKIWKMIVSQMCKNEIRKEENTFSGCCVSMQVWQQLILQCLQKSYSHSTGGQVVLRQDADCGVSLEPWTWTCLDCVRPSCRPVKRTKVECVKQMLGASPLVLSSAMELAINKHSLKRVIG